MENTAGSGSSAAVPSEPGPERVPLTVPAAAQALGISERAVRKRITTGTLEGIRDGSRWLVYLPEPSGPGSGLDRFRFAVPAGTSSDSRYSAVPGTALDPLLEDLRELRRRNEDLAGQVGFWQGRYQESLSTIKLLSAPVSDAVELQWLLSNRRASGGNSGAEGSCHCFGHFGQKGHGEQRGNGRRKTG